MTEEELKETLQKAWAAYKEKQYKLAMFRFYLCAAENCAPAQYMVGYLNEKGLGTSQSFEKALEWYEKAVQNGEPRACYNLGRIYQNSDFNGKDVAVAAYWYAYGAEHGSVECQCELGKMYEYGEYFEKNYEEAAKWYKIAADKDDAISKTRLASLYECGLGVEQSYKQAIILYREAAYNGNVNAQYALGRLYETGTGIKKSYPAALRWYKSAYHEHKGAAFRIGLFYEFGCGVTKNFEAAFKWYRLAAKMGNVEAKYRLGIWYEKRAKPPEYTEAVRIYEEAANENFAPAQIALARLYDKGLGVEKSKEKAEFWRKKAKGNPLPQGDDTGDDA